MNSNSCRVFLGSRPSATRSWLGPVGARISGAIALVLGLPGLGAASGESPEQAVLDKLKDTRGIAVLVEPADAGLAEALTAQTSLKLFIQLADPEAVSRWRETSSAAGTYGQRVFVAQGPAERLLLADSLADAVIALGPRALALPESEVRRVLRPQGQGFHGTKELTKDFPEGMDEWTHPYHGPDNNPLSEDRLVRAPYLTQFLEDPRYAPLPQLAVAAGGRVFKAFGHLAFKEREEPWLNTLAAFSGYNGSLLWRRPIAPALMVHRNVLIATPEVLYFGDDRCCQVIQAATGKMLEEIVLPADVAGGTFWKWMGLEDGVLYALIGEQEQRDPVIRLRSRNHGWPWDPLSPGFNRPEHTWGFGRVMLAVDPATKRVLWRHQETDPIDSRAVCLKNGRIYLFRFGAFLTCLDARTGTVKWRLTPEQAPELFAAIGDYQHRQDWRTNWRTAAFLKCGDEALYFAGPPVGRLVAVSTEDGHLLWQHPYGNFQLVLCPDGLYGISGQIDHTVSRIFHPLTGQVLKEIPVARRACSRPTGCGEAIFFRASGGSVRLDLADAEPGLVSPMRAQCHDGVTIAHGLLYWWPSVCDCNLTLYGITCLGPAGDFSRLPPVQTPEGPKPDALEPTNGALPIGPNDWPTFRANNRATATSSAAVPDAIRQRWIRPSPSPLEPSAVTAAGGLVFVAGMEGRVQALDARTGSVVWTAYTGGAVRLPPTLWQGRALAGSADGWVYAYEARTGRLLWRFQAAPADRWIPVYGRLQSTWPAASGVLVADGTAYVAAGIVNYDGTFVYALDAATGRLKWANTTSGHLDPEARTGVSVQGHLLLEDDRLYLAGGNVVSPGIYEIHTGRCLNDPAQTQRRQDDYVPASESPRGWELYALGDQVFVSGKPYYAHPDYPVFDASVFMNTLVTSTTNRDVLWVNKAHVLCYPKIAERRNARLSAAWGKPEVPDAQPIWEQPCPEAVAFALARNAAIVATPAELRAIALENGRTLWRTALPACPVDWGLTIDREGQILVALKSGQVLAYGGDRPTNVAWAGP